MKKIVSLFSLLLVLLVSNNCYGEVESLKERIAQLEERVAQLEAKIAASSEIFTPIERGHSDRMFPLGNNWYYSTSNGERDEYIEEVFAALFSEFIRIFGEEAMSHKPVTIYNVPGAASPMAIPLGKTMRIRLVQNSTGFWAQLVYQLSHEMTHYMFFSYFPHADQGNYGEVDDKEKSSWNEEIICEAMSLYMLKYMSDNWEKCALSKINPAFNSALKEYLDNEYKRTKNLPLKSEGDAVPFGDFHARFNRTTNDLDNHITERNYLYDLFVSTNAETIGEIGNMYKHYNKEYRYIDYASWIKAANNPDFIKKISAIQPRLSCLPSTSGFRLLQEPVTTCNVSQPSISSRTH